MIKFTSLEDLIVSLISKAIGNNQITFVIYLQNKGNVLFEFTSDDFKFIVSKREDGLRVYAKGNIYLINNILPENYPDEIDSIIKQQAKNLQNYYKLDYYLDKINKDTEANVYRFIKLGQ
jgi:hypothetical protein